MNPRERILAGLHHQAPDRTPTTGWFHQEVQERLMATICSRPPLMSRLGPAEAPQLAKNGTCLQAR